MTRPEWEIENAGLDFSKDQYGHYVDINVRGMWKDYIDSITISQPLKPNSVCQGCGGYTFHRIYLGDCCIGGYCEVCGHG